MKQSIYATIKQAVISGYKDLKPGYCSWKKAKLSLPEEFKKDKEYRGIKTLLSWTKLEGRIPNQGLTFQQAERLGYRIKKSAHGVKRIDFTLQKIDSKSKEVIETHTARTTYVAFNLSRSKEEVDIQITSENPLEEEARLLQASGALIKFDSKQAAFFNNELYMMPECCLFCEDYYTNLLHELTQKVNLSQLADPQRYCKDIYTLEQAVIEEGDAFLCTELGGVKKLQYKSHKTYNWLPVLRAGGYIIFKAADSAQQRVDYLIPYPSGKVV